jgi:hypothetical protein
VDFAMMLICWTLAVLIPGALKIDLSLKIWYPNYHKTAGMLNVTVLWHNADIYCRNSMRLWLHGDGGYVPVIDNDYESRMVANITDTQLASIQWLLDLGNKYNVLFNLCLWSFDMVNDNGYGDAHGLWNKIVTDEAHTQVPVSVHIVL